MHLSESQLFTECTKVIFGAFNFWVLRPLREGGLSFLKMDDGHSFALVGGKGHTRELSNNIFVVDWGENPIEGSFVEEGTGIIHSKGK